MRQNFSSLEYARTCHAAASGMAAGWICYYFFVIFKRNFFYLRNSRPDKHVRIHLLFRDGAAAGAVLGAQVELQMEDVFPGRLAARHSLSCWRPVHLHSLLGLPLRHGSCLLNEKRDLSSDLVF